MVWAVLNLYNHSGAKCAINNLKVWSESQFYQQDQESRRQNKEQNRLN